MRPRGKEKYRSTDNTKIYIGINIKNKLLSKNDEISGWMAQISKLMTRHNNHPFHLVDKRLWAIIGAIGALIIITGLIKWFYLYKQELILIGITIIILTIIQ